MNFLDNITLFTCSYNSNMLTSLMIKSAFKQLGQEIPVVIMDNGNKQKCSLGMKEVFTVIDNTNFKLTPDYHQVSKNHCSAIDYALKNCITTKYVMLCDSDILFKPEIKELFEFLDTLEEIDVVCEIGTDIIPPDRIFPYMCLINVEKFKNEQINFFNKNYCINGRRYDTGYYFYTQIKDKWNINKIKLSKFITHLHGGTYHPLQNTTNWLDKNRNLF